MNQATLSAIRAIKSKQHNVLSRLASLKAETLQMYQPLPPAAEFHASMAKTRVNFGSNRCLGGEQEIYDPVRGELRRVDSIDSDFHVYSLNPETGEIEVKRASRPFIKGHGALYRVRLSNDEVIVTTLKHRILTVSGSWVSVEDAYASGESLVCEEDEHVIVEDYVLVRDDVIWDITVDAYSNYLMAGVINKNSGKTETGVFELARAVLNCDPYNKFPQKGLGLIVSEDMDHLGALWRKLTSPGEIKKIRDEHTNLWRAVRYDADDPTRLDPYDDAYREKWADAPPILPTRSYQTPSWENASREIPRYVKFNTGWNSLWRSSEGKPQKGEHYNLVLFDEQLHNEQFYIEARRGSVALMSDTHVPRLWWNATPQITNLQLQELVEAAETGDRDAAAFLFLIVNNPYVPEAEKQSFYNDLSEDERLTRWEGKFALSGQRVYPTFNVYGVHGQEAFAIPPNWTRYFTVDPGTKYCATLFYAVDPEEQHVWVYDEVVINASNLPAWSAEVKNRQTDYAYEAAVMDNRAGIQHQMGLSTKTTAAEYFAALREAGVVVRTLGPMDGFHPGMPNIAARETTVRRSLEIRGTGPFEGTPKLQVFRGCCPKLEQEIKYAHYDLRTGKRSTRVPQDVVTTLEYTMSYRPGYHEPRLPNSSVKRETPGKAMAEKMEKRRKKQRRRSSSGNYGDEMSIG